MKESYQAFITSSLLFIAAEKAAAIPLSYEWLFINKFLYLTIVIAAITSLFRGVLVLLPFPLLGDEREKFDLSNPEAYLMSRSNRIKLFKHWRKQKAQQDGAGQPPTAPQSKYEGNKNTKQESKVRSQ